MPQAPCTEHKPAQERWPRRRQPCPSNLCGVAHGPQQVQTLSLLADPREAATRHTPRTAYWLLWLSSQKPAQLSPGCSFILLFLLLLDQLTTKPVSPSLFMFTFSKKLCHCSKKKKKKREEYPEGAAINCRALTHQHTRKTPEQRSSKAQQVQVLLTGHTPSKLLKTRHISKQTSGGFRKSLEEMHEKSQQ